MSVLAASLLVALTAATSAAANAPAVQAFRMDFDYVDTWTCGFPIAVDGWLEVTTRTFVDADGAPIRSATRNTAVFTWVGPTGFVVSNHQGWNSSVDLIAGTQTITGVLTRVVGPSVGLLLNDVGRLVLQVGGPPGPPVVLFDKGGQDSIFEPGVWDPVCAYLAG
ncbi:MAG TPA: hypothetical protein VFN41_10190 [Candidatus Limnocylindrales bacterium]|nr:hypothetical protein [Candidatus Limnocylindrales bacterium]